MQSSTGSEVKYVHRTEKAVRGLEGRTRKKMEDEGWELVSQTEGRLSTEMQFRKPAPKAAPRRMALFVGLGALAVILALVITIMSIREKSDPETAAPAASSSALVSPSGERSSASSSSAPSASASAPNATETITASNNPEFASILALTDQFDPSIQAFVTKYQGRKIEFDANICAMGPHGSATTRFDILICAGDYSETKSVGPNFQFRDVNVTSNLHLTNQKPSETIGRGDNLHVVATIDRFEAQPGLLLLEPVETSFR